jgi:hypothetical protein
MRLMACASLLFLALLAGSRAASAEDCVDPRSYADSVVRIERAADDHRGISWVGSGWFHGSQQVLITNEHVTGKLGLSTTEWTTVQLTTAKPGTARTFVQALRARLLVRDARADVALVQLERPAMGVRPLDLRIGAVAPGEPLAIAGYAGGLLHFGTGRAYAGSQPVARYHQPPSQFAIDVQGDANLDAFAPGGSGSPVMGCDGTVAGIFSNYIDERYLSLFGTSGAKGRPTPRASPNAFAIKVEILQRLYASLPAYAR